MGPIRWIFDPHPPLADGKGLHQNRTLKPSTKGRNAKQYEKGDTASENDLQGEKDCVDNDLDCHNHFFFVYVCFFFLPDVDSLLPVLKKGIHQLTVTLDRSS